MLKLQSAWSGNYCGMAGSPVRHRSSPDSSSGGGPVLAKAAGLLSGSQYPVGQADPCGAAIAGALVSALRLERSARHRHPCNFRPLARQEFQVVLALEIAGWPATAAEGNSPADRSRGTGERDLGRGAGGR
jgi:hypothetical protein